MDFGETIWQARIRLVINQPARITLELLGYKLAFCLQRNINRYVFELGRKADFITLMPYGPKS
jgi:hypothetical protein